MDFLAGHKFLLLGLLANKESVQAVRRKHIKKTVEGNVRPG